MANILNQVVIQDNVEGIEKRLIIQYTDDQTQEKGQNIVNYSTLTAEEESTYNAFISLSNSKIV